MDGKGTISKDVNDSVTTIKFFEWAGDSEIKTPKPGESESDLKADLTTAQDDLKEKQNLVISGISVTDNIKDIKELEKEIEKLEKDIIKAEKKQSKVKVEAFFTKNKKGSKQTVEFTYDGGSLT